MIALTLRLPASLHRELKELARLEGVSINQFLTLATAEKISALRTLNYLEAEAKLGSREDFDAFLAGAPDAEPVANDQL